MTQAQPFQCSVAEPRLAAHIKEGPGEGKGIARAGSALLPGRVFALVPIPSFQEFMFTSKIFKRSCSVEWNKVEMGYDPAQTLGLGFLMHESSGCVLAPEKESHHLLLGQLSC